MVIFTITSGYVKPIREGETVVGRRPEWNKLATVGFFSDLATAQKCVEEDWGGFEEAGYYNFIVIERTVEGLYNISGTNDNTIQTEWWYLFDHKERKWKASEKPNWSLGIIGWGLS